VARRGPETTTPLRRRLFGWPDTQGRCHREGWSHWSCLGVLAVVPGAAHRADPIRRIKPRPSPRQGPRSAGAGCLWLSRLL